MKIVCFWSSVDPKGRFRADNVDHLRRTELSYILRPQPVLGILGRITAVLPTAAFMTFPARPPRPTSPVAIFRRKNLVELSKTSVIIREDRTSGKRVINSAATEGPVTEWDSPSNTLHNK